MSRARAAADLALAALAGAALGSLIHALAWPVQRGLGFLDVKLVLSAAGVLPLAALGAGAAGLAAAVRARRARREPGPAAAAMRGAVFAAAALTGLGVLAGAWAFHLWIFHAGVRYGVIGAYVLGVLVPWPAPPLVLTRGLGAAWIAALALLAAGVGYSEQIGSARVEVPEGLAPLPEPVAGMRAGAGPDVLLISVDTLRADDFLDPDVPTPALDALRARGRWAEHARAPAPSTLPSHVTMLTGEPPGVTGCYTNSGKLAADAGATLPEVFRQAGWRAAGLASNAVLNELTGFARGFEAFSNLHAYPSVARAHMTDLVLSTRRMSGQSLMMSDAACVGLGVELARLRTNVPKDIHVINTSVDAPVVGDAAMHYLDQLYGQDRPWFFFLHFMDPHLPYDAAGEAHGKLSGSAPLPERYAEFPRMTTFCANAIQNDLREGDAAARADALQALRHARALYREELMAVDAQIARVLERLERSGRPCVVMFTADHGEHFGEFDELGHGHTLYEEVLRVPFFFAGPGVAPGRMDQTPRLEDVGLTLLRAANIPARDFGAGRDLAAPAGAAEAPIVSWHEDLLSVTDGGLKAIFGWDCIAPRTAPLELRWLCDPADETVDLRASRPEAAAALQQLAEAARANARDRATRALSDAERAQLEQLGYVFDAQGNLVGERH